MKTRVGFPLLQGTPSVFLEYYCQSLEGFSLLNLIIIVTCVLGYLEIFSSLSYRLVHSCNIAGFIFSLLCFVIMIKFVTRPGKVRVALVEACMVDLSSGAWEKYV